MCLCFVCNSWAVFQDSGYWKQHKCEICGKEWQEWISDYQFSPSDLYVYNTTFTSPSDDVITLEIDLCDNCREKYADEFQKFREKWYKQLNKWIQEKQEENQELRAEVKKIQDDKKRKRALERIKDIRLPEPDTAGHLSR